MTSLLTAFGGWQPLVDAPGGIVLLVKITATLLAAWLAHLALKRANPRWRVVLWRVTAVGLIALPAIAWLFPALEIHVQQPLPGKQPAAILTATNNLPSPSTDGSLVGRVAGGENRVLVDSGLHDNLPFERKAADAGHNGTEKVGRAMSLPKALPLTLSHRERGPSWTAANGKSLLLAVWLGGIAVLVLRLSIGHYRIWRMVRRGKHAPQWICEGCSRVAEGIGCRAQVELLQSADIPSPFLCGLRRPLLLLPARMCDDSYCRELPGILAHELTHARSHDVLWNVGLQVTSIMLWFHPLAWRMRKAHLAACELVCDAASASFVGDVTDYCRTLARVAVDACASLPAAGIAMARTSAISRRLSA